MTQAKAKSLCEKNWEPRYKNKVEHKLIKRGGDRSGHERQILDKLQQNSNHGPVAKTSSPSQTHSQTDMQVAKEVIDMPVCVQGTNGTSFKTTKNSLGHLEGYRHWRHLCYFLKSPKLRYTIVLMTFILTLLNPSFIFDHESLLFILYTIFIMCLIMEYSKNGRDSSKKVLVLTATLSLLGGVSLIGLILFLFLVCESPPTRTLFSYITLTIISIPFIYYCIWLIGEISGYRPPY